MNDIIRERYPFEPTKKIADDLGLSEGSVYNRAYAMGIKKDPVYEADADRTKYNGKKELRLTFKSE